MKNLQETKILSKKVIFYTILTTFISASIGLGLFLIIQPIFKMLLSNINLQQPDQKELIYLSHIQKMVPSNIIQSFHESNVIAVLCLAILFGVATLLIDHENRLKEKETYLTNIFKDFFKVIMKITTWIVTLMPIAI